jgi:hypothetical protein
MTHIYLKITVQIFTIMQCNIIVIRSCNLRTASRKKSIRYNFHWRTNTLVFFYQELKNSIGKPKNCFARSFPTSVTIKTSQISFATFWWHFIEQMVWGKSKQKYDDDNEVMSFILCGVWWARLLLSSHVGDRLEGCGTHMVHGQWGISKFYMHWW